MEIILRGHSQDRIAQFECTVFVFVYMQSITRGIFLTLDLGLKI